MQVDTDLQHLVNHQEGRLKRCSLLLFVRDFADCVRNRLWAGNVQSTAVAG